MIIFILALLMKKSKSNSKKLSTASATSGVSPTVKFGSIKKFQENRVNITANNDEKADGLELPKESNRREVKSVIKEEPEKG